MRDAVKIAGLIQLAHPGEDLIGGDRRPRVERRACPERSRRMAGLHIVEGDAAATARGDDAACRQFNSVIQPHVYTPAIGRDRQGAHFVQAVDESLSAQKTQSQFVLLARCAHERRQFAAIDVNAHQGFFGDGSGHRLPRAVFVEGVIEGVNTVGVRLRHRLLTEDLPKSRSVRIW